jgi:hypothetical protein
VSPLDGAGYRTLWFSRWRRDGRLAFICLHSHDSTGIRAAWGAGDIGVDEFAGLNEERAAEEGLMPVPLAYALQLLRHGLYMSHAARCQLPAEFHVLQKVLEGEELAPGEYRPDFSGYSMEKLAHSASLIRAGGELFDHEFFSGWYMATCRVYDYAEEWDALEQDCEGGVAARGQEILLERFYRELIVPLSGQLADRLLLTADLLRECGAGREIVATSLAVALSIGRYQGPVRQHPFLHRLAFESIAVAREALAEGYDLRENPHEADDNSDWD